MRKPNYVAPGQRWSKTHHCPICGHYQNDPTGHCDGFGSEGGAICTRAEYANGAALNENCVPPGYFHKLEPDGTFRPWTATPPIPFRTTRRATVPGNTESQPRKTHATERGINYFAYTDRQRIKRADFTNAKGEPDKSCIPEHLVGGRWQTGDGPEGVEYIFRRREVLNRPGEPLHIFEGETCAEAGAALGLRAMTWRGGTGRVNKAMEQIIAVCTNEHVVLHTDSDQPGRKAMKQIAAAIAPVAASVRILDYFPDVSAEGGGKDIED